MSKKEKEIKQDAECAETVTETADTQDSTVSAIAAAEEKANEFKDMAQRIQAEFENYRKRNNDSIKNARLDGANDVILALLPVIDAVDIAKTLITEQASLAGVQLIRKQLTTLLEKYEVEEIACVGEAFNPDLHNAVLREEAEGMQDKIIEVLQKGYIRKGKVIRYAMVKVGA